MVRKHISNSQKPIVGKKELSGAAKVKRAEKIQEENNKLAANSSKYFSKFIPTTPAPNQSVENQLNDDVQQESTPDVSESNVVKANSAAQAILTPQLESQIDAGSEQSQGSDDIIIQEIEIDNQNQQASAFEASDLSTWPYPLDSATKNVLVSLGPPELRTKTFPSVNSRSFNPKYLTGLKKNSETYERNWLNYNQTYNSLFCFPCCLFGILSEKNSNSPWVNYSGNQENVTRGFSDFKHLEQAITRHEESKMHFQSVSSWRLQQGKTNIASMTENSIQEENHWNDVLCGILDAILFLAKNNLSFRGSSDNLCDKDCGNFLSLIKLLGKHYPPLTTHINRLKSHRVNYLSHDIQNEFIKLCGTSVKESILEKIRNRKYFSILFDSTPDTSHTEQVSQIIRTVSCSKTGCQIEEHFVDFISTNQKTGKGLAQVFIEKLTSDKLNIQDCRGQGYDNGANMSGINKGVQKWIIEQNSNADFIPCAAHSLNLVGLNAAEKVLPAKMVLGQIQNIFVFFSASTSRWEILKSKVKVTLKGQSSTRWAARYMAISALHEEYFEITEALIEMTQSKYMNADALADASSRLNDMMNFKFLLAVHIWYEILGKIQICNNSLQKKDIDIERGEKLLSGLLSWLKEFRNEGFKSCYDQAVKRASTFGIDSETGFEDVRRKRRKTFHDETPDSANISNLDKFELEFFNALVDRLILEINQRFVQLRTVSELFGFLWGNKLVELRGTEQQKHVKDLCTKYSADFNTFAFCNEMEYLVDTISPFLQDNEPIIELGPMEILNVLYKNELESSFPNVETALRIFLTLPVSVASNERAFSKLKIIKTYLRSTMGQERLTNLAIISIEYETAESIDYKEIIRKFVSSKCRKVNINI